jgi:hypothetical protein
MPAEKFESMLSPGQDRLEYFFLILLPTYKKKFLLVIFVERVRLFLKQSTV